MVETQLTPELIEEGAMLVAKLDASGISPDAALWVHNPEAGVWKMLLVEANVGENGPRQAYRSVQKALKALGNRIVHLSLEDISVTKPNAAVIRDLRKAVSTSFGTGGVRFKRNVIDGTMIEDAYIYRLEKP